MNCCNTTDHVWESTMFEANGALIFKGRCIKCEQSMSKVPCLFKNHEWTINRADFDDDLVYVSLTCLVCTLFHEISLDNTNGELMPEDKEGLFLAIKEELSDPEIVHPYLTIPT